MGFDLIDKLVGKIRKEVLEAKTLAGKIIENGTLGDAMEARKIIKKCDKVLHLLGTE